MFLLRNTPGPISKVGDGSEPLAACMYLRSTYTEYSFSEATAEMPELKTPAQYLYLKIRQAIRHIFCALQLLSSFE